MMDEKIFDNWKKSGLLDGLSEKDARMLAEYMENTATLLLNVANFGSPINKENRISTFAFPILKKIFNRCRDFDYKNVYHELSRYYDKKWHLYEELNGSPGFDNEGEFCCNFSEEYIATHKNRLVYKRFSKGEK